jgi:uncharacterized membrane protein
MNVENSVLILQGVLFLSLAYYYVKRPPKKINDLYGYRTRRSMSNQEVWDFANRQSAKDFLRAAIATMITGLVLLPFESPLKIFIQLAVLLLGIGVAVWHTKKEVNKYFDKDGNKKS